MRPRFSCLALLFFLSWVVGITPVLAQGATCTNSGTAGSTTTWTPWECVLEVTDTGSNLAGRNAYLNRLKVEFSAVGAAYTRTGYAAWDGSSVVNGVTKHRFVIRHQFERTTGSPTTWTWRTVCETPSSCGSGKTSPSLTSTGQVIVSTYTAGSNSLQSKGPIRPFYFVWYGGTIWRQWASLRQWGASENFTWIADSAWAAPMKAADADWQTYVNNRSSRVTVIQIGPAPAWAGTADKAGRIPFVKSAGCSTTETVGPTPCDVPNMEFWRSFENKIKIANQAGLYIFLTGLMEPRSNHEPYPDRPEYYPKAAEAVNFAHWLAARLGGSFVIFSPGFDAAKVVKDGVFLQAVVGQELKRVNPLHLVTNHWATIDLAQIASLHNETWLDFEMFQSGSNEGAPNPETQLTRVTQRAREMAWKISGSSKPPEGDFTSYLRPAINGEAIYDQGGLPTVHFSDYRARQAGYLSWLSGASGYSFGVGGIWDWGIYKASMPNGWKDFSSAMAQNSANSMQYMKKIMASNSNYYLDAYDQDRILNQESDQWKKMVVGREPYSTLAYLPHNQSIKLRYTTNNYTTINPCTGMLYDPKTGMSAPVCPISNTVTCSPSGNCNDSKISITCSSPADNCTWRNSDYSLFDAPASDRVLQLNVTPARLWEGEAKRGLQVFAGMLAEGAPWGINGWLLDSRNSPIGLPFPLVASPGLEGRTPAVAHDGKGDFLVVWQARKEEDGQNLGIFGQRVHASGELEGGAFRISPASDREVATPSVALDSEGNAVAVWQSTDPASGNGSIWARSMSRTNILDQPTLVATGTELDCSQPKAAMSRNGSLSVAWIERDLQLEQATVRLRHSEEGKLAALSWAESVNTVEAPGFWLINLHLDDSAKLELEYEARFGPQGGGTYLQAFAADGSKLGAETILVPTSASEEAQQ